MINGEATNTNFIVVGLTRPGLEPTIYRTRGEHANHYTIDTVRNKKTQHRKLKIVQHEPHKIPGRTQVPWEDKQALPH